MHEKLTLKEAQELRSYYRLRDKLKGNIEERREMKQLSRQKQRRQKEEQRKHKEERTKPETRKKKEAGQKT